MSTILNALKKARSDREKTVRETGTQQTEKQAPSGRSDPDPVETPTQTNSAGLASAADLSSGAGGAPSPAPTLAGSTVLSPPASWHQQAADPPRRSSGLWIIALVGVLAAVLGGGFVHVVLTQSSKNEGGPDGTQTASAAALPEIDTSAHSETNASREAVVEPSGGTQPGEAAPGGKVRGGQGKAGAAGGSQLDSGSDSQGPAITDDQLMTGDLATTRPLPTPSPIETPEPTPSAPPRPTLFPEGSSVMPEDLGLRIEGIMYDEKLPSAIVNDRIAHQGDVINEVKILEINQKDLLVEWKGRKLTVEF